MMEATNPTQVKEDAHNVIWHIKTVAAALEHAAKFHGNVLTIDPSASEQVKNERAKAMNVIGALCKRLIAIAQAMRGELEMDIHGSAEELVEQCDLALSDFYVNPLKEQLKRAAQEKLSETTRTDLTCPQCGNKTFTYSAETGQSTCQSCGVKLPAERPNEPPEAA